MLCVSVWKKENTYKTRKQNGPYLIFSTPRIPIVSPLQKLISKRNSNLHDVKVVITILALDIAGISALAGPRIGGTRFGVRLLGASAPAAAPAAADGIPWHIRLAAAVG